jgi:hypothetical protein
MLNSSRERKASMNKVGEAIVVAGRADSTNARSQILHSLMYVRMIVANPAPTVLAGSTWEEIDALKDTRGINEARDLERSGFG